MPALSASVKAAKQDRHPGHKPAETSGTAQGKGGTANASEDGPACGDSA
jgi:hypothetical protein